MMVTEDNIDTVIAILEKCPILAVDTETTGLNVRNGIDFLQGLSISGAVSNGELYSVYFPFRHKTGDNLPLHWRSRVQSLLNPKPLIFHHRKFDMHSLRTLGISPLAFEGNQYDTLLLFHLWNENLYSYQMDSLAPRYLGDKKYNGKAIHELGKTFGWDSIPADVMEPYACKDTDITYQLFMWIWPKIVEAGLNKVYLETEMPFTRLLYKLEQRGVGVNKEFVAQKAFTGRTRMATIQRELGFNPASPIALGKVLLDELNLPVIQHTSSCPECKKKKPLHTHTWKASFNKIAMEEYDIILSALDNPTAKRITEYRGWQKAVTSLYEPLLEKVGPDGLIRTEFKQHGTRTGRLSASNPNLQQIPRDSTNRWNGNAKSSFHAGREGFTLIGWDYSQLELRLAAAYGTEQVLLREFTKPDADPFAVLAPLIFGYFSKETRHWTKTFVYANLYGAGPAKIALQLNRSLEETQGLYKNYKDSISGIMSISNRVGALVKQRGYVKYWDGRIRHIEDKNEAYKGWNSVCQGGGAQLVKKAMLRCEEFEDDNCFMVLQVHDEITFCIRDGMIDQYESLIKKAMTDFPDFGVTFAVDGKEWNDTHVAA